MRNFNLRNGILSLALLGLVSAPVFAQANLGVNPNLLNNGLAGQALARINAVNQLQAANLLANPYYMGDALSSSYYGNPYYPSYDPYGGALRGAADVVNAQGKFMVSREQAFSIREQTRQAKIDTRRRLFDEYQYERSNTPTANQLREIDIRALPSQREQSAGQRNPFRRCPEHRVGSFDPHASLGSQRPKRGPG
jgi:hypothetical protein